MPPFITRGAYAVFKSELVYTVIACVGFYFYFKTDSAIETVIPSVLPILKTANIVIIYGCILLSAKKFIELRSGAKRLIEKGDIEESKEND